VVVGAQPVVARPQRIVADRLKAEMLKEDAAGKHVSGFRRARL
jgi:hypothetical protein